MLIHIDPTGVADALTQGPTSLRSHSALENLLHAHVDGDHVISVLPGDVATLRQASWSARARRALDHIDASYSEIAGLRADAPWSLEVGLGPDFTPTIHAIAGGPRVLRAPLHAFEKTHPAARAMLLGENHHDADFFVLLAQLRRADRHWEAVAMIHEPRGAGGSTFAPEYKKAADTGRILLAIADSDRRHPQSGDGGTYSELKREAEGHPAYQRARPLPTRTAEALVPLDLYEEVFSSRHGDARLGSVTRLKALLGRVPPDVIHYAHLKDGITLWQVEHPKTEGEGTYWDNVAERSGRNRCNRSSRDECTTRDQCKCYVVDDLGGRALSDVVDWLSTRKSKKELAKRFAFAQNPELSQLADEVLSWGLALPPLLT